MAKFDRFLLFSASPECKWKVRSEAWPKTAEIDQGAEAKVVDDHLAQHCLTGLETIESGRIAAEETRSKPPSTHPAQTSVFQDQKGDV